MYGGITIEELVKYALIFGDIEISDIKEILSIEDEEEALKKLREILKLNTERKEHDR